jgi:glycosyltransferase involved in cell wall biosynthesis
VVRHAAFAVPGDLATPTGGYAYDRRMIAELEKLGWRIDVVNLGDGFPRPSGAQRAAALTRLKDIPAGRVVVIDGLALGMLPEEAAQVAGARPLVALVHHPLALESGLSPLDADAMRKSERSAIATAKRVIVTSPSTARALVVDYGVSEDLIVVALPGNDPVAKAKENTSDVVRLLAIGAIVPRKGFDILIAALARLTDLSWHLTIAGDRTRNAKASAQLDADVARFNLGDRVTVLGAVSDEKIADLYRNSDVFTLASRHEGYGMAFSEAIARGIPVVATTAGAIPETVPAEAGLLVPPDDIEAFARSLRRVIANRPDRERLAAGARMAARKLPTWQASAEIFSGALEAAL